jgi:hypothetical protein
MRIEGLIRMLMYRYGFRFLQKGADHLSRPRDAEGKVIPNKDLTPEQKQRRNRNRKATRNATKAARLASRMRRF